MEKEEKWCCSTSTPRIGKKLLFSFVVINIAFWFIYYNSCYVTELSTESKHEISKVVFVPIYDVPLFHIPLLDIKDMSTYYTEIKTDVWCLKQGTYLTKSKKEKKCVCIENWFGLDCGIPSAVWKSTFLQEGQNSGVEIRRRKTPRRLIFSYAVDDQIDLFDINVHNIFSVVDLFLTIEVEGESVLNLIRKGYFPQCQNKIIPLQLNSTHVVKKESEWSEYMLSELWKISWERLTDFRPDDILLFSHVSSIMSKDVLLFLKLYDGFPEPFSFELRPLLFKFWRQMKSNTTNAKLVPFKPFGCTFQFISAMCDYSIEKLFSNSCVNSLQQKKAFEKHFWTLENWLIGNTLAPSGWQCNLCCKPDCIKKIIKKYVVSGSTFLPLQYVLGNVSVTEKFVDQTNSYNSKDLFFEVISNTDPFYAPDNVLYNNKYSHLIN